MKKTIRIILGLVFMLAILFSIPAFANDVRTSSMQPDGKIVEQYEGDREVAIKIGNALYEEYGKRISSVWIRIDEESAKMCVSIEPKKQKKCFATMELMADTKLLEKERQELEKDGWKIVKLHGEKAENVVLVEMKKTIKY